MDNNARPNLNTDKDYLDKVESLIEKGKSFGDIHFEYLDNLVKIFFPDTNIYDFSLDGSSKEKIQNILEHIFAEIEKGEISQSTQDILFQMWDYLCEADKLEKADLIFVFGGISRLAVEQAIDLKLQDYAPKIMFSGKHASYVDGIEKTEAEQYRDLAISKGVPHENILIENTSINTPENIVNSKEVLTHEHELPKSVIAVSLPYHMRRAHLTMWAGFDWSPKIIRFPGKSAKYTRENYYKDIKGFSYIFFEYLKIYGARQMGHF